MFEALEPRQLLAANPLHAWVTVFIDSKDVAIPAHIGVAAGGALLSQVHTQDTSGELLLQPIGSETLGSITLGDFFTTWRTNAGQAGNNSSAVFSSTNLMGNATNATKSVQMFVNGQLSTSYDKYVIQNSDEIVLGYGSNPVVSLNTNFGPIVMELLSDKAPGTVQNFLNYVNDGDYTNTFFHRLATNFVLQGGGFTTSSTVFTGSSEFSTIPTDGPIANEFGVSNTLGTVGMVKTVNDPNSATDQFFINLGDNSANLDLQNGGFTVFAQVLDLASVADMAALPIATTDPSTGAAPASPFDSLPVSSDNHLAVVQSVTGAGYLTGEKFLDANGNGVLDSGETGIAGVTVYLDTNGNGIHDTGEISTTTDANGQYLISIDPGTYTVRAEVSSGRFQTLPAGAAGYPVTVTIGREQKNLNFGQSATAPPTATAGVGLVDPDASVFYLKNACAAGMADTVFPYGQAGSSWLAVSGDWDGDGRTTIGLYDPAASVFYLRDSNCAGVSDRSFGYGAPGAGWLPLAGDWNGDGTDTVGLYDPHGSVFYLTNSSTAGVADVVFPYGTPEAGWLPVAGDWNADKIDTIGLYDAATSAFYLRNSNASGYADSSVPFGVAGLGWKPIAGDWNRDRTDSIGLYDPTNSTFYLRDSNSPGYADAAFGYGQPAADWSPIAGVWTVAPVNAQPVAAVDAYRMPASGVLTLTATTGLLSNDHDPDGDTLTALATSDPLHGVLTLHPDGSLTYTPQSGFHGTDSFTYVASDGTLQSAATTVTIAVDSTPQAVADSYQMNQGDTLSCDAATGLLANDSDPDGDPLTAKVSTNPAHGTLTVDSDGSIVYSPEATFHGTDTYTYVASDGMTDSAPATVTIAVAEFNHPPVATGEVYHVGVDSVLTVDAARGVLANDTDPDGDLLAALVTLTPANGNLTMHFDGSFTYTPHPGFHGTDLFLYEASDGPSLSLPAGVTIDVNTVPAAVADAYQMTQNQVLSVGAATGVLANDVDADGDPLTAQLAVSTGNGVLTFNADGSFTYTPKADFQGTDTFRYQVSDGRAESPTVDVTINVAPAASSALADQALAGTQNWLN